MQAQHIDKAWFEALMLQQGLSLRAMAARMQIDPSALSRSLNGQRKVKPSEIQQLAKILKQSPTDILAHISGPFEDPVNGLSEMAQSKFQHQPPSPKPEADATARHPLFGIWKGKVKLDPNYDYTQPADPDWGKVYDD